MVDLQQSIREFHSQNGPSLYELSTQKPLLLVFLRHGSCPFCREALARLAEARSRIEEAGVMIGLVHMMSDAEAVELFRGYRLDDVPRFSDPERVLYEAFGLIRGSVFKVMGPRIWWRGFTTTVLGGHLPGKPRGDIFQLQGTFLIHNGEIVRADRPEDSSSHPDYADFATCELPVTGAAT